jgi:hypothetical protein
MPVYFIDQFGNRVIVSILKIGDGLVVSEDLAKPGVIAIGLPTT